MVEPPPPRIPTVGRECSVANMRWTYFRYTWSTTPRIPILRCFAMRCLVEVVSIEDGRLLDVVSFADVPLVDVVSCENARLLRGRLL